MYEFDIYIYCLFIESLFTLIQREIVGDLTESV